MCPRLGRGSLAGMNSTVTRLGPLTCSAPGRRVGSQLARFAAVGAGGYLVNLAVFTLIRHAAGDSLLASAVAFAAAVAHNFAWNRRWTFAAGARRPGQQAIRFLTVSIAALALMLGLLWVLTRSAALPALPAPRRSPRSPSRRPASPEADCGRSHPGAT